MSFYEPMSDEQLEDDARIRSRAPTPPHPLSAPKPPSLFGRDVVIALLWMLIVTSFELKQHHWMNWIGMMLWSSMLGWELRIRFDRRWRFRKMSMKQRLK